MRDASNGNAGTGTIKKFCKPVSDPNPDKDNNGNPKGWLMMSTGRYEPSSATVALDSNARKLLNPMGHPRDMCHAVSVTGSCSGGRVGDGIWDRAAYFESNYGKSFAWTSTSGLGSNVTRYQTYLWELNNQNIPGGIGQSTPVGAGGGKLYGAPVCQTPGVTPQADIDRRRLTVAIVNCTGANAAAGKKSLDVTKWVDMFLVEPSWDRPGRTTSNDLYVEIIGTASIAGPGGQTYQVERSVPYLIR